MKNKPPQYLTFDESYADFHPVGEATLDQTIDMVDAAIGFCRDEGIRGVLVDITCLTGLQYPTTADRFFFIQRWADTARGKVAVSMVAPAELIDPDKIGVTMAKNRGLESDVFLTRPDAVAWLNETCGR